MITTFVLTTVFAALLTSVIKDVRRVELASRILVYRRYPNFDSYGDGFVDLQQVTFVERRFSPLHFWLSWGF